MDQQIHSGRKQSENRLLRRSEAFKVVEGLEQRKTERKQSESRLLTLLRQSEAFKSEEEEQLKTEKLFLKVRSILNELTRETFLERTQQIVDLDIDTEERLEGLVNLIFERAINEAANSVVYANLCRCLIPKRVVTEKYGVKKDLTFRKILLNKCQEEFERKKLVENKISEKLEDRSKQGLTEEELEITKSDLLDEVHKDKQRALGNIQFIGELFKLKMLTESIMHNCVVKLLKSNDEESFECLCKLLVTIGKDLDNPKAKPKIDQYIDDINKKIQGRTMSFHVKLMMQNIVDLRNNNWVPREVGKLQMAKQDNKIRRGPEDFNARPAQAYQLAGHAQKPQNIVMPPMPGQMQSQGQPRLPNQPFHHNQRGMRIPRQPPPTNQPMYSSPPGDPIVQMIGPPEATQFIPPGKPGPFIPQHVDFAQIPMADPPQMQYRPQQAVQGQFPPVSGPSQPQGHFGYQPSTVYQMEQPSPPVYIVRAPTASMPGMPQYQAQTFEPRTREKKIIQILDPNSNKDVTQEILNRHPSGSLTSSTGGTPNNTTPDISGQSSSSSTPPLTSQQQAEANVRAQLAAQVAATLRDTKEEKPRKPEYTIQKAPASNRAEIDVQGKEAADKSKNLFGSTATGQANSSTSQHSARIQEELRTVILKRKARNEDVFDWVDKNVSGADTKDSPFIRALVTVVCEGAMDEEEGGVCKCNVDRLKDKKNLLQKYIDDNTFLELQALYAVQALFVKLDHPPGFIKSYFDSLYDEEIITEESFYAWQTSPDEEPGKSVAVIAASDFFRWLKNVPEELDDSEDSVAEETTQAKTEEDLSDEETRNNKEVYLRNDDEDGSCASFIGGYPFNKPMKSEVNTKTVDLIRSLDYCKRQNEVLEGIVQQLRTSQKESKAKEEDFKMKIQTLEKKLRDQEQENVVLKKAHKEELQQLRTSQTESKAKEEDFKMKLQTLEKELRDQEQENVVLNKALSEANQCKDYYKSQVETRDWVISRDDIQVTNTCLGSGGCGFVLEGRYCGCAVAIKKLHSLTPHERKLFQREMDIASRCRHPCLLQFIGATNDEENPLFVTELMEKSLRKLLHEQSNEKLSDAEIAIICLDVARALNYLHQRKPTPIVHRDVSSANVLLWQCGKKWRGKLSDYGTARLVEEMMTRSPGAMIYSAPEAATSFQTVKVDVYSFGVLLCEMCIQDFPDPERRKEQVALMKNREFGDLVERCLAEDPDLRPDMDEVIETLEQFDDTS